MKRIYIIFMLLCTIAQKTNGQGFAPLHAQWHYQYWSINSNETVSYYKAHVDRDTIIDNRYVTFLLLERDNAIVPESEILINEQNDKVYFFENDSFKLFFDYNLNAGDTFTFSVPQNYHYYDISCGDVPNFSATQFSKVKIDSVTQNSFGGQLLNVFHTSPIEEVPSQYFSWDLGPVYERIGSKNGIFGYSTTQCLGGNPGHFRCYEDSLIQFQSSTEVCDFILSTDNELNSINNLKIFPNPTMNSLSFNFPFHKNVVFEIYNQLGQLQYTEVIEPVHKGVIKSVEFDLDNGIYLAVFKSIDIYATRQFYVRK